MNNKHIYIRKTTKNHTQKSNFSITTYDQTIGVIRIIDTSVDSDVAPSISPIKLNRSLRRNIKKPISAKNV